MIPDEQDNYTLNIIARISGVHADTILHYQELGFIQTPQESA